MTLRTAGALLAILVLPGSPCRAQVTVTSDKPRITSGETCTITATLTGGGSREWSWALEPPYAGSLRNLPGGQAEFTAPFVPAPHTFLIRATDPEGNASSTTLVRVDPAAEFVSGSQGAALRVMSLVQGPSWHLPQLSNFAGQAGESKHSAFDNVRGIHLVTDPAMGGLDGTCLVIDDQGLWVVSEGGKVRRLALRGQLAPGMPFVKDPQDFPAVRVTAVAARPAGTAPENPRQHTVVALSQAAVTGNPPRTFLCNLWPDGTVVPIMGSPFTGLGGEGTAPGEAHFHEIRQIAMDRQGNLFTIDLDGRMDHVSPAGEVHTLCSSAFGGWPLHYASRNSGWRKAAVTLSRDRWDPGASLAADPATGDLWVSCSRGLYRVGAGDGAIVFELGAAPPESSCPESGQGMPIPRGTACLKTPGGCHMSGGLLFIAETGGHRIRAFDPRTRALFTVAGHPSQPEVRFGPVPLYQPALPPTECAALGSPLWVQAWDSGCLVGLKGGVVRMDLPSWPLGGRPGSTDTSSSSSSSSSTTTSLPSPAQAPARVTLQCSAPSLRSGQVCDIRAIATDGGSSCTWNWRCTGGFLAPKADGRAVFTAPRVHAPTTVHVLVEEAHLPGVWADMKLAVLP